MSSSAVYSSPITRAPKDIPRLDLKILTIMVLNIIESAKYITSVSPISYGGINGPKICCESDSPEIEQKDQEILNRLMEVDAGDTALLEYERK